MYLVRNKAKSKDIIFIEADTEKNRYEIYYRDYANSIPTELVVVDGDLQEWNCFLAEAKRIYNEQRQRAEYKCFYNRY